MTGAGHGRRLRTLVRKNAPPPRNEWMEALYENARVEDAVRAMVAFALHLAGTDKLPSLVPTGGGNAPLHVSDPPPRQPPLGQKPRWTKDNRPGPHDVLTWEEAMQVPWYDPLAEEEG